MEDGIEGRNEGRKNKDGEDNVTEEESAMSILCILQGCCNLPYPTLHQLLPSPLVNSHHIVSATLQPPSAGRFYESWYLIYGETKAAKIRRIVISTRAPFASENRDQLPHGWF